MTATEELKDSLAQDIADVAGIKGRARHNKRMGSHELCGPCPLGCGASDAFHVYPDLNYVPGVGYLGYFLCMDSIHGNRNGCGQSGNMIDLVCKRDDISFSKACEELGIDKQALLIFRLNEKIDSLMAEEKISLEDACKRLDCSPQMVQDYREKTIIPKMIGQKRIRSHVQTADRWDEYGDTWRSMAYSLMRYAYGKMDEQTRAYLHDRQITGEMIKDRCYGLYPQYKYVYADLWGNMQTSSDDKPAVRKKMVIPRGIIIPWFCEDGQIRCVRVRRLPWDESEDAKRVYGVNEKTGEIGRYFALAGSSAQHLYKDGLWTKRMVKVGSKAALFEGEFTTTVAQEQSKDIVCIGTGSTSWGFNLDNQRLLAGCEKVLVCYDTDSNDAGDRASQRWLDALGNTRRWRPLWGDANDMAFDGVNVGGWLAMGFEDDAHVVEETNDLFTCAICRVSAEVAANFYISDDGRKGYCDKCWKPQAEKIAS